MHTCTVDNGIRVTVVHSADLDHLTISDGQVTSNSWRTTPIENKAVFYDNVKAHIFHPALPDLRTA